MSPAKCTPFKGIFSNVGNYINSEKIVRMSSSEKNAYNKIFQLFFNYLKIIVFCNIELLQKSNIFFYRLICLQFKKRLLRNYFQMLAAMLTQMKLFLCQVCKKILQMSFHQIHQIYCIIGESPGTRQIKSKGVTVKKYSLPKAILQGTVV